MKIFHLASEYPPQKVFGLGRFVHDLSVETAWQQHEVHVVTNSMSGKDFEIQDKGVYIHRVDFPPPPKPSDGTTTVIQFNTQLIERAVPIIRKSKPDIINSHDWLTFLAGRALNRIFNIHHVLTIHDTMFGKKFGKLDNPGRLAANIEQYGCSDADITICCSEYIKKELISIYKAQPDKIRIVPCAVDERKFDIANDKFLLENFRSVLAQPDELIICYVGRLDPEKGIGTLLNAIPMILKTRQDIKFVFAGKGEMEDSIRTWVRECGLERHVKLIGYISGSVLAHVYKTSDIQVVPSTYEPFGIVALEGMVNGLAVIVADTGGLTEIVDHEVTGLKFPSNDINALAQAILYLADNEDLRRRLGIVGRAKVQSDYSWKRVADLTQRTYLEVCNMSNRICVSN